MPLKDDDVIFSICIEDVQNVAEEEIGRTLTTPELKIVVDKVGDYFPWYDPIASVISDFIQSRDDENEDG